MSINDIKAQQLGMPIGTAMGRLRKEFLFSVLVRHNENICVRCENAIATVEELSIEHILPWLHNSPDLFWDLDNVGVSHMSCNREAARPSPGMYQMGHTPPHKRTGPDGTAWCAGHKDFLPRDEFHAGNRWDGLRTYCKRCRVARL